MRRNLKAISISRTIADVLSAGPISARVLNVFRTSCNLLTQSGQVVTLVTPDHGNAPLNVMLEHSEGSLSGVQPGTRAQLSPHSLSLDRYDVDLTESHQWEPCPQWERLRRKQAQTQSRLAIAYLLARQQAIQPGLLAIFPPVEVSPGPQSAESRETVPETFAAYVIRRTHKAVSHLGRGLDGNPDELVQGTEMLAGLGGGLTPAGDDFLMGVMTWIWLGEPAPERLCHPIAEAAISHTTILAGAMLRAAQRGECKESWHRLLNALADGPQSELALAVRLALRHGTTSGADTLAGFLWAGLRATS